MIRLRLPPDALTPRDPLGIPIDTDMIQWPPEGISAAPSLDSSPADLQDAALLFNRIGTSTDAHFGAAGINASGETGGEYFGSPAHLANVAAHRKTGRCQSAMSPSVAWHVVTTNRVKSPMNTCGSNSSLSARWFARIGFNSGIAKTRSCTNRTL